MPDDPPSRTPQPALRLIFEYEGGQLSLVNEYPVTMVVHDSDPEQNAPGVYIDSRSRSRGNMPLARVRAPNGMMTSAEVFPAGPGERLYRVDQPANGSFSVVVPALAEADHVALVQVESGGGTRGSGGVARAVTTPDGVQATATDIREFPLRRN